jgi:hypothetical protein
VSSEALALGFVFLIHAIGLCVLFGAMIRSDGGGWRDWWPRDEGDDGGGGSPPPRPDPGPPLPGAEQSPVRLREPGRLADAHPRAPRRPEHPPQRVPQRERV